MNKNHSMHAPSCAGSPLALQLLRSDNKQDNYVVNQCGQKQNEELKGEEDVPLRLSSSRF